MNAPWCVLSSVLGIAYNPLDLHCVCLTSWQLLRSSCIHSQYACLACSFFLVVVIALHCLVANNNNNGDDEEEGGSDDADEYGDARKTERSCAFQKPLKWSGSSTYEHQFKMKFYDSMIPVVVVVIPQPVKYSMCRCGCLSRLTLVYCSLPPFNSLRRG